MKKYKIPSLLLLLAITTFGCKPNFLKFGAEKNIVGDWQVSRSDGVKEVWSFSSEGKLVVMLDDTIKPYPDPETGTLADEMTYTLEKKMRVIRLYIPGMFYDPSADEGDEGHFQFLKFKKDEIYLYSIHKVGDDGNVNTIKGSVQLDLTKL